MNFGALSAKGHHREQAFHRRLWWDEPGQTRGFATGYQFESGQGKHARAFWNHREI